MNEFKKFQMAKAIFLENKADKPNTFAGFVKKFEIAEVKNTILFIAGRTFFRIFINKQFISYGPARTGHGKARVDEIDVTKYLMQGENIIEVEVAGYAGAFAYENEHTCEFSFLIAEIMQDNESICATDEQWEGKELYHRRKHAPRHSHCRPVMEIWHLDEKYYDWSKIENEKIELVDCPELIERLVNEPLFEKIQTRNLVSFGEVKKNPQKVCEQLFFDGYQSEYADLSEDPAKECFLEEDCSISEGEVVNSFEGIKYNGKSENKFLFFDLKKLYVGLVQFEVELKEDAVIDIVYAESMDEDGGINPMQGYRTCIRVYGKTGMNKFTSFETYALRYLKIIIRSAKDVFLKSIGVLTYTSKDTQFGSFLCDDEDINKIYEAAKLTLQLNTLDVFMDCPDRERAGWICDSLWTGRASALMFGDNKVEKAMLENFLCLPAETQFNAFFPSCYPAQCDFKAGTILTWTFWMIIEIEEYYKRTGDRELVEMFRERLEHFVVGAESLCNNKGLFETKSTVFIDWSLSNNSDYVSPISTAANALYAYTLEAIDRMYDKPELKKRAMEIREILVEHTIDKGSYDVRQIMCDSLDVNENGDIVKKPFYSEAAQYTMLWSELFDKNTNPKLIEAIVNEFGPCPTRKAPKLDVGEANMFIGLCIRLDMLSKLEEYEKLFEEIKAIFGSMIKKGPGTLWETLGGTSSRAHGFTAQAGAWLVTDVLGIKMPQEIPEKKIALAPNICGLKFAKGVVQTENGAISLDWSFYLDEFKINFSTPKGYEICMTLPKEALCARKVIVNGKEIKHVKREMMF